MLTGIEVGILLASAASALTRPVSCSNCCTTSYLQAPGCIVLDRERSAVCTLCSSGLNEDCAHTFLACNHNSDVSNWVLDFTRKVAPNSNPEDIICLNLDLAESVAFPLIWSLSHVFFAVWQLRLSKKAVNLYNIRAEMEAKINILRKSRLLEAVSHIEKLLDL